MPRHEATLVVYFGNDFPTREEIEDAFADYDCVVIEYEVERV